jgi:cell division protein FtsL
MLVNKKQEWDIYEQLEVPSVKKRCSQKPDIALRVKCLTTVILIALAAIIVTACSESIIRAGYELVQLKSQVNKLEKENELLQLDIAKLRSPQRIQTIAINELGMVVPQNVYYAENMPQSTKAKPEKEKSMISMVLNSLNSKGQ